MQETLFVEVVCRLPDIAYAGNCEVYRHDLYQSIIRRFITGTY